jgi:hypothetical protein
MQPPFSEDGSSSFSNRIRRFLRLTLTQIFTPSVFPVALLIDGDNHSDMSSELLAQILVEAGKFGGVMIRKVYGNWREPTMDRWKDFCVHYALEPIHYPQITATGKNAADIALALDALDLYRCNGITHFCLIASDSDYLPLVQRLRANGCFVVVIGKTTTLPALVKASTVFITLEQPVFSPSKSGKGVVAQATSAPLATASVLSPSDAPFTTATSKVNTASLPQKPDIALKTLLLKAYDQAAKGKKDGWVSIQGFHAALVKLDPSFKLSNYHYKNFAALFQAHVDLFETRKQSSGHLALRKRT